MSIEISAEDLRAAQWNELIARSSAETPFHHHAVLETVAEYADSTLHTLVGYKGQQPIGVFPLFERSKGPISIVHSPPSNLQIPYLGPLLLDTDELKTRRRDVRNHRFIRAAIEWIDAHIQPRYINVQTGTGYTDIRPFIWQDYDVTPRFTYQVTLPSDPDELLARFSGNVRNDLRTEYEQNWTITHGEPTERATILAQVRARYAEQSVPFLVSVAFLDDLHNRLPEGRFRQSVCRIDGSFAGGILTLETDHGIYGWLGSAKTDSNIPVNDLLQWRVCTDAIDRGLQRYDLIGANNERIYSYKAKFAPELHTYYNLQTGTWDLNLAANIYRRVWR